MKPEATTRDPVDKGGSSANQPRSGRRDAGGGREAVYDLRVAYYATMKPQRVYPLVVEVVHGPGAADGPTAATVTLRPVVPGALVAPAELPLDVSRTGARATFQVTPVAKGRLPEACVRVLQDGRPVQELRTRMTAKTQRTSWVLLLLALILPPFLVHWTVTEPLAGGIPPMRKAAIEEKMKDEPTKDGGPAQEAAVPGKGAPGKGPPAAGPPPLPPPPPTKQPPPPPGTPGEILRVRIHNALRPGIPEVPYSDEAISVVAVPIASVYDILCQWGRVLPLPFMLAVALLIAAFGSWALHKPTRVNVEGSLALPRPAGAGRGYVAETGETLPLARSQGAE